MNRLLIALCCVLSFAIPALAAPGEPRFLQGTVEWPAALNGEPVMIVRGDDGRVYAADVSGARRQGAEPVRVGGRVALLVIEGARAYDALCYREEFSPEIKARFIQISRKLFEHPLWVQEANQNEIGDGGATRRCDAARGCEASGACRTGACDGCARHCGSARTGGGRAARNGDGARDRGSARTGRACCGGSRGCDAGPSAHRRAAHGYRDSASGARARSAAARRRAARGGTARPERQRPHQGPGAAR